MNTALAQQQMVAQQIRTCEVFDDNVLDVIRDIPRDRFVPERFIDVACADTEIRLPHGQCMLRPTLVGQLLQSLDLKTDDRVLEIGAGTGYLTACLSKLTRSVTSIDVFEDFVSMARQNLRDAGIENVSVDQMDVMTELPDDTFDVITITSAVPELRQAYTELLNPGGRLFIFAGDDLVQSAMRVVRRPDGEFDIDELFESNVPGLVNLEQETIFSF